ncbi:MAG: hypothetical protein RL141_354 [Candidatus Parcubacteria bacterium]|jgi:hypothetical protein
MILALRKRWVLWAACAALVVLLGLLSATAIFLWGVYVRHWEGPVVTAVAKVIPVPAASLGDRRVLLREYLADVRSVKIFLASEEATAAGVARDIAIDDRREALERLLHERALQETAEARAITVTPEQTKAVMDEFGVSATSTEAFADFLERGYGWTVADFESHVVQPLILTRLLSSSFAADHDGDLTAFDQYLLERLARKDVVRYIRF